MAAGFSDNRRQLILSGFAFNKSTADEIGLLQSFAIVLPINPSRQEMTKKTVPLENLCVRARPFMNCFILSSKYTFCNLDSLVWRRELHIYLEVITLDDVDDSNRNIHKNVVKGLIHCGLKNSWICR